MKEVKIKDICTKGSSNLKQKDVEGRNGLFPVYGASGLIGHIDYYEQENPYIALVKDGSIGKLMRLPAQSSCIGTIQYIYPCNNINLNYLFYCLSTINFQEYKRGASIPHIYFKDYGERIVNIEEDVNQQKRIVQKLDELYDQIETAIKNAKLESQEAERLFSKALNEYFNITDSSHSVTIESIADVKSGYSFKSQLFAKNGDYQVIRMGNVRPGFLRLNESPVYVSNLDEETIEKSLLVEGDIIITQTGTRGKRDYGYSTLISDNNLLLNQRMAYIRPGNKVLSKYIMYYTWTEAFRDQFFAHEGGTVGQGNVGMDAIRKSTIVLPNIEKQSIIVSRLDKIRDNTNNIKNNCTDIIKQLKYLRVLLTQNCFK